MGIIRKSLSMTTAGLVDFRSDKERIARSTRHSAHEMRKQTEMMRQELATQRELAAQLNPPPAQAELEQEGPALTLKEHQQRNAVRAQRGEPTVTMGEWMKEDTARRKAERAARRRH